MNLQGHMLDTRYAAAANSSVKMDYTTPVLFYNRLDDEFHFTLDPCASPENAKCAKFFTYHENGLVQGWGCETVFMNPPYGYQTEVWMAKALRASQKGATVVCLIPARTSTRWWHDIAMQGEIRFIQGKIRFIGTKFEAPQPHVIIIFRPGQKSCFIGPPVESKP